MLADTLVFNDCKFTPDSRYVIIEKPSKGLPTEALDRFEVETLLSILSLFSNKIIRVVASKKIPVGYSFTCLVEDGNFTDFENAQTNFKKLLSLDSSIFSSYIDSAQLFSKSLLLKKLIFQ